MTDQVHAWASTVAAGTSTCAEPAEFADVDVDEQVLWDIPDAEETRPVYAWIAGEAGCVKELRRHLVRGVGLDRKQVAFMGYWRHGKAEN
ncbi:SIP domain-containing protein [Curtobacterium flaccumfaciens]|nr:SIP domain-containing protein [Curtobacterium flaccumfaciens]